MLCQPEDAAPLRERGFTDVRPVEDELELATGCAWRAPPARHGTGEIGGDGAGLRLRAARRRRAAVYVAGDTIWCDEVREALDAHAPDVVVVNAGGARFNEGDPIVMTADDVVAVTRHAPGAHVVAVHLEAINHCLEPRGPDRPLAEAGIASACPRTVPISHRPARHGPMSPKPQPSSGQIGQK